MYSVIGAEELQTLTNDKSLREKIYMAALEAEAYRGVDSTVLIQEVERMVRKHTYRNGGALPNNRQLEMIFDIVLRTMIPKKYIEPCKISVNGQYVIFLERGSYMLTNVKEEASTFSSWDSAAKYMRELWIDGKIVK